MTLKFWYCSSVLWFKSPILNWDHQAKWAAFPQFTVFPLHILTFTFFLQLRRDFLLTSIIILPFSAIFRPLDLKCHLTTMKVYTIPLAGNETLHSCYYLKTCIFLRQIHLKMYFLYCGWLVFLLVLMYIKRPVHRKQRNIQCCSYVFLILLLLIHVWEYVTLQWEPQIKKSHLRKRNY